MITQRNLRVVFGILAVAASRLSAAETVGQPGDVLFENQVAPILEIRCGKCHGQDQVKAGLDLRRKFTMLKGGDSGPAIVPGKPDESLLVQRIEQGEMPPAEEGRLDQRQRTLIRRWVAAGAPTANPTEPPLNDAETPTRLSDEDRRFWSFQPPTRPAMPDNLRAADRVRTPIDAFLLEKLATKTLTFNSEAAQPVLLRRLSLDLLGRPPTLAERDDFLADVSPEAYERLVDRLLDSPEYGERWGRHWLDVAGYADSDGYLAADRLRPEAWRYRDYVIQAHNDDLPYDQFLTEQLAGDELSDWRRADELTPEMARQLVATGFLRTALDPTYPGYTEPNEIYQVLSDTLQIVGTSLLGLTLHCARCHAHKFDPISQRDYYSLQAAFLPALDPARWKPSEVRGISLASDAEQVRLTEHNKQVDERVAQKNAAQAEATASLRKRLVGEALVSAGKTADAALVDKLVAALLQPTDKRNAEQKTLIAEHTPGLSLAEADLAVKHAAFAEVSRDLKAAIAAEQSLKKPLVLCRGLTDVDDQPASGRVLLRGDHNRPGPNVEPAVPEVLAAPGFKLVVTAGQKTTGRRRALAKWLTDPANPLTARVQVNRMWRHHFGRGLAPTVANLGRSGVRPTHPELLDWLATEFVRLGWSQKAMHRLMLTSTAYRQASTWNAAQAATDPDNVLLSAWQPRRLEGEVLRDSLLAVSDRLNPARYGKPSPVAAQGDGSVVTADDPQGNRRSIYLIVRRSQHLTMLDLFDTPLMEVNCPERTSSIVPLQALALLHGPFAERSAAAVAERVLSSAGEDAARIALAYRLLFGREPQPSEIEALGGFLAAVSVERLGQKPAATPADVSATERAAWTQAALVLLNTNEFLFVQ